MPWFTERSCPGSLALPDAGSVPDDPDRWVGRCGECGAELALGYAGLLPVHAPADRPADLPLYPV
jgi:hypothetical protein